MDLKISYLLFDLHEELVALLSLILRLPILSLISVMLVRVILALVRCEKHIIIHQFIKSYFFKWFFHIRNHVAHFWSLLLTNLALLFLSMVFKLLLQPPLSLQLLLSYDLRVSLLLVFYGVLLTLRVFGTRLFFSLSWGHKGVHRRAVRRFTNSLYLAIGMA